MFSILRSLSWLVFPFGRNAKRDVVLRAARQIAVSRAGGTGRFALLSLTDPARFAEIYREIFVPMTAFFRDPDVFAALERDVLPRVLARAPTGRTLRIWVPGCSSGEEAYSIAILLVEALNGRAGGTQFQVFGTDRNETSLERARAGIYPSSCLGNVSPSRLQQHFVAADSGCQISQSFRERCLFARHNLADDPPYPDLDLVSCRNVIQFFLKPAARQEAFARLHQCLKPGAFLILGKSESIVPPAGLFAVHDRRKRIFIRRPQ